MKNTTNKSRRPLAVISGIVLAIVAAILAIIFVPTKILVVLALCCANIAVDLAIIYGIIAIVRKRKSKKNANKTTTTTATTNNTAESETESKEAEATNSETEETVDKAEETPVTPVAPVCDCKEAGAKAEAAEAKKTADEAKADAAEAKKTAEVVKELAETGNANLATHIADTAEADRLVSIQKNHAEIENLAMRYLKYKQEYSETQFQLGITGRRVKQLEAASDAAKEAAVTADTDAICAEGEYDATLKNKGRTYLAIGKKQRADGANEELAGIQAAADEAEIRGFTTADEAEAKNEAEKRGVAEAAEAVKVKVNAKAEYSGRLEELTVLMENIERKLREEYKLNDKEIEELLNPKA